MNRIICWIKTLWGGWPFDFYTDGHVYVEDEKHERVTVTISHCENCGKQEIGWYDRPPQIL